MKHLITTLILLIATAVVTVTYFKNLNQPGKRPTEVMRYIPDDASLVAEFNNDEGFYEAFSGNKLLTALAGPDKTTELEALRKNLLDNAAIKNFFDNQHIFISIHPLEGDNIEFLLTTSANGKFKGNTLEQIRQIHNGGLKVETIKAGSKETFKVTVPELTRPFFLTETDSRIITGSFSQQLVNKAAAYDSKQNKDAFLQMSDQQHENALAILYINYSKLQPLFQQWFKDKNPDLLRALRLLPAKAALSLNYKTNALMFNGLTELEIGKPVSYLNLFSSQQPIVNHLKDVFPATTAYSSCFAVSYPKKFVHDLADWNNKGGNSDNKKALFNKIKAETGVNFDRDFNHVLSKEFAVITTRFEEKLAIIEVSNGQQLRPSLVNISTMQVDDVGQFNYTKIPFYLLGDAFGIFNKPYFTVINNYVVLANTASEIRSYTEAYNNQKFLSQSASYNEFDDLLSERSNVAFFINFKNAKPVLKRQLKPAFNNVFQNADPGFNNYYAASYQLIASDKNYYTNFCMKLAAIDSTTTNNK